MARAMTAADLHSAALTVQVMSIHTRAVPVSWSRSSSRHAAWGLRRAALPGAVGGWAGACMHHASCTHATHASIRPSACAPTR